jgi:hypothetical protein
MNPLVLRVTLVTLVACALPACGRPFQIATAPGFVELQNQPAASDYEYRSTTPEGVTLGVRVVADEKRGDLAFWTRALTLQLRDVTGYALLGTFDVRTSDDTPGKLLKMGHDEDGKPYGYWLAVFMAQDRLYLVEAGGPAAEMDRTQPQIEWMMKTLQVRCHSGALPILASRTCNRW